MRSQWIQNAEIGDILNCSDLKSLFKRLVIMVMTWLETKKVKLTVCLNLDSAMLTVVPGQKASAEWKES